MTKDGKPRGISFTPGAWKFLAAAFCFIIFLDQLGEANSFWTWTRAISTGVAVVLIPCVGHRPSPRRLW